LVQNSIDLSNIEIGGVVQIITIGTEIIEISKQFMSYENMHFWRFVCWTLSSSTINTDGLSNPLNKVKHNLSKKGGNDNMEEGKRQNPVSEHEMDRFSILMFGNKRQRRAPKEIEETEDHQTSPIKRPQRLDWISGRRREEPSHQTKDTENHVEQFLNGIDQQLLFKTLDTAAAFMNTMKPLLEEIKPHLNSVITRFTKK
jgi:hypothetical protein